MTDPTKEFSLITRILEDARILLSKLQELGKLDQRGILLLMKLQTYKEEPCFQDVPAVELLQLLQQLKKL